MTSQSASGRCSRTSSHCCFPKLKRNTLSNAVHCFCHLIKRNRVSDPGKGKLGTSDCVCSTDGVTALTWSFNQSGDRIAYHSEQVGHGDRCSLKLHFRCSAHDFHNRTGSHGGSCTNLSLASGFGAGYRCISHQNITDCGGIQNRRMQEFI